MKNEGQLHEMAELMCDNFADGICAVDGATCNHNCEYKLMANHLQRNGYHKCNAKIYYVIQNLNTGEYWRGKGATWGKSHNKAVIYVVKGTAEHNVERLFRMGYIAKIVPIKIAEVTEDGK